MLGARSPCQCGLPLQWDPSAHPSAAAADACPRGWRAAPPSCRSAKLSWVPLLRVLSAPSSRRVVSFSTTLCPFLSAPASSCPWGQAGPRLRVSVWDSGDCPRGNQSSVGKTKPWHRCPGWGGTSLPFQHSESKDRGIRNLGPAGQPGLHEVLSQQKKQTAD